MIFSLRRRRCSGGLTFISYRRQKLLLFRAGEFDEYLGF
jgi:hypothetical protein